MSWIMNNIATIIIALIVFGVFIAIIASKINAHRHGKGGCGCGCDSCPSAGLCHPKK